MRSTIVISIFTQSYGLNNTHEVLGARAGLHRSGFLVFIF